MGVGWALAQVGWPRTGAALAAAIALLGVVAAWRLPLAAAELSWDGRHWSVDGRAGSLDVMIDLQQWLLLRLRSDDGAPDRWVAVAGAEAGAKMPLLRVLVHAGPAAGGDRAAGRPGASPSPSDR